MKVNGIEFTSQTEYLAALRDKGRIDAIKARVDVTLPQTAATLYKRLKSQPYYFETEVGKRFLRDLQKTSGASSTGKSIVQNRVDHSAELEEQERNERLNSKSAGSNSGKKTSEPLTRKSAITVLEGSDELRSRYNADSRIAALDELTKSGRQKNEFWDDEEELKDIEEVPKKTNGLQKLLLMLIGAAAAIVLVVFLAKEVNTRIEDYKSSKKLKELQNIVLQATDAKNQRLDGVVNAWASDGSTTPTPTAGNGENAGEKAEEKPADQPLTILPEFKTLAGRNEDMVGWIQIPGTIVNYPVMQTKSDMEYYLTRDFDGQYDKNGLPFVDSRSDVFDRTTNVIIYGHCMNSGSMFASLLNYKDKSYYDAHRIIYFDTLYERAEYEIVACFQSKVAYVGEETFRYYNFVDTDSEEEFDTFINNIKTLAYYDTGLTAHYGDALITLSTCDKEIKNGRMVIVARKISR